MKTAKIFMNGRSQAVRLPRDYRFDNGEVYIKKIGDMVLLVPKEKSWELFMQSLKGFSEDFMNDRRDAPPRKRKDL